MTLKINWHRSWRSLKKFMRQVYSVTGNHDEQYPGPPILGIASLCAGSESGYGHWRADCRVWWISSAGRRGFCGLEKPICVQCRICLKTNLGWFCHIIQIPWIWCRNRQHDHWCFLDIRMAGRSSYLGWRIMWWKRSPFWAIKKACTGMSMQMYFVTVGTDGGCAISFSRTTNHWYYWIGLKKLIHCAAAKAATRAQ